MGARQVSKVDPSMPQDDAKAMLIQKLETFVQEKIVFAGDVLVSIAATKVEDGDVILTYGFSTTVYGLLLRAALKVRAPVSTSCGHQKFSGRALAYKAFHVSLYVELSFV